MRRTRVAILPKAKLARAKLNPSVSEELCEADGLAVTYGHKAAEVLQSAEGDQKDFGLSGLTPCGQTIRPRTQCFTSLKV